MISSDTLVNFNANDPDVVTTGPASLDPDTGQPYGLSFPAVAIADFVRVQRALVEFAWNSETARGHGTVDGRAPDVRMGGLLS